MDCRTVRCVGNTASSRPAPPGPCAIRLNSIVIATRPACSTGAVIVVSGGLPKRAADGSDYSLYAAVIVKRVDAQTRSKTSINELLRA